MKRAMRNCLVRLIAWFILKPKGGRVICLHEINDATLFLDFLHWLKQEWTILSLGVFLKDREPSGKAALTFDDGFSSWVKKAAPLLQDLEIPATFFVSSGCIDLKGEKAQRFLRKRLLRSQDLTFISGEQLRELSENPLFRIGSHTVNHVDLGKVKDQGKLQSEIDGDRKFLQDFTGQEVKYFAYPFGHEQNISEEALTAVEEAGFEAAFTYIPGNYTSILDPYRLNRDALDLTGGKGLWRAWLKGGYDGLSRMKSGYERLRFGYSP